MLDHSRNLKSLIKNYAKWTALSVLIGACCGIASAIFLASLEWATGLREAHSWLLFLLPFGGLFVGLLYHRYGKEVEGGNNLLIEEFHDPKKVIPFRMAPLVLIGTITTHIFGGSAGREGTAVQMGGSIADQFTHLFKLDHSKRKTLIMAGMAGGFGSVFGVPFAGTVFGIEVLAIGKLQWSALLECTLSAFVAHSVTLGLGIHHTNYPHVIAPDILAPMFIPIFYAVVVGIACGITARLFAFLNHIIARLSKRLLPLLPLRSFVGGLIISLIFFLVPLSTRYAGLGVPIIIDSLKTPLPLFDWIAKLLMTALTLGTGFKGGEVTPLLFVGSTLGNAMSQLIPLPLPLMAAMGFVGVFAGAANTPLACTIMAMELFGNQIGFFALTVCLASYCVSGHKGIYHAQRIHIRKNQLINRAQDFVSAFFRKK